MMIVDNLVERDQLYDARDYCNEFGYKFETESTASDRAQQFYNRADDLRNQYNFSHYCVITTFDPSKYKKNPTAAFNLRSQFDIRLNRGEYSIKIPKSLCRNCIDAFHKLCRFTEHAIRYQMDQ
ncbi:hypothetical protein RF11_05919 [Thelohanellus kitauei]|uniref:Uncharacterized protein n=1 Tax=Thelohanellus kitauei TaxID=669202 RepID=A0A0C2N0B3_THEKT|nr:hypothetical protein RF11_05919 [Thelohanellus kitauei]